MNLILLGSCSSLQKESHRIPAGEGRIPTGPGIFSRAEGFIGGNYNCQKPTAQELSLVDQKIAHLKIDGHASDVAKFGNRMVENYIEEIFFQELAFRSHAATSCQLSFLKSYFNDRDIAHTLNENGWRSFEPYSSVLHKMIISKNEKSSQAMLLRMGHDPMDRSSYAAERMIQAAKLSEEASGLDQAINVIIAQIPMGTHKVVRDGFRKLILQPSIREDDFLSTYSESLEKLKPKIQAADDYFRENLDKDGFYKITRGDKIAYMQSGRAEGLLKEIDPKGDKLACRVRAQYSKGPATVQLAGMLGLIVASAFTDGAAAVLVGLGMTATMVADVQHQCFQPTMNVTSQQTLTCDPKQMAITSLSEASMLSCGVSVALLALPAVTSFSMELRASYKAARAGQRTALEIAEAEKVALLAKEAQMAKAATIEDEIVVVARRRTFKIDEPVIPAPKAVASSQAYAKVVDEVRPCIEKMPADVQKKLRDKFRSQSEDQTAKDLRDIRDLRRINGNCR